MIFHMWPQFVHFRDFSCFSWFSALDSQHMLDPLLSLGLGYKMPPDIRVVVFGQQLIQPIRSLCMECKGRLCRLDAATERNGVRAG